MPLLLIRRARVPIEVAVYLKDTHRASAIAIAMLDEHV